MTEKNFSEYTTRLLSNDKELAYAINTMRVKVTAYILDNNLKSIVLGISGGIDSAFAAALLRPVCDNTNTKLIGRSITIETNTAEEISRANTVGLAFCHDYKYLDYTDIYLKYKVLLPDLDDKPLSKLRMGNAKARFRMMALYDLAQLNKGLVISTDNYTEYLTGFWTLHGDVGDYAPFINLWKTEVYACANYLCKNLPNAQAEALKLCINAIPTDGLGISTSDLEQLGEDSYADVDNILIQYIKGNTDLEHNMLIQRYINSEYKRKIPIQINRSTLFFKE